MTLSSYGNVGENIDDACEAIMHIMINYR